MITMQEAANVMPVDWALNNLAASILLGNGNAPEFYCTPSDIDKFEAAAPDLAEALVNAAAGQLPTRMPDALNDEEAQELDRKVSNAAQEAFHSISANSRASIKALVMAMLGEYSSQPEEKPTQPRPTARQRPMTTAQQQAPATEAAAPTYRFIFQKRIERNSGLMELQFLPEHAYITMRAEFEATEEQALQAARAMFGLKRAKEALRMSLAFDRLPPEALDDGIQRMAEQYSEQTGEKWTARPDAEIPLDVFAELLELANESYWERYEKTFHLDVVKAQAHGIDVRNALQRE